MKKYYSTAAKQKLNKPKTLHGKSSTPNANLMPWMGGKKPGSKKPKPFAKGGRVECAAGGSVKGNPSDDLTPKGNLPSYPGEGFDKPKPKPKPKPKKYI